MAETTDRDKDRDIQYGPPTQAIFDPHKALTVVRVVPSFVK